MLNIQLKHTGTVFSGRVGDPMPLPRHRPRALRTKPARATVKLRGGPLHNEQTTLTTECGVSTLPMTIRGMTGRYVAVPIRVLPGGVLDCPLVAVWVPDRPLRWEHIGENPLRVLS